MNLSRHIPLFHIINTQDYGFELGILYRQKIAFAFNIDYGAQSTFIFQIGEQLYEEAYMDKLFDAEQTRQFQLFGFPQDVCDRIQHILTYQNYQKDELGFQMVQELYDAVRLKEFYFVLHNYISNDKKSYVFTK